MVIEGGLRKPERKAIKIDDPNFWNEKDLDIELRRQFDVCHSCRRCFNLCDSFPKLFDLIDERHQELIMNQLNLKVLCM